MATRAMYLTVKVDADTKYYSLVQAVFDHVANNYPYSLLTTNGVPNSSSAVTIKNVIDTFFSGKKGASITTTGETLLSFISGIATSETITSGSSGGSTVISTYFSPTYTYASSVFSNIGSYIRFKIASMTDADYTAFVEKFRANIKAGYPTDRVWNETNSPEA